MVEALSSIHHALVEFSPLKPYLLILLTIWITYGYSLKTGWVIDDLEGIVGYDGNLQTRITESIKSDKNIPDADKTKQLNEYHKQFIFVRLLQSEYGMINRWFRYHLCGGNFPSKHLNIRPDGSKGDPIPQGKVPFWHHVLSINVFSIACFFLYTFIASRFSPKIALLSVCLFIVHPVVTQGVAWASGLGYPLSLVWMGAALNLAPFIYEQTDRVPWIASIVLFCVLQFLAVHAQFATMMMWTILLFFGYWHLAVLGFLISFAMGFDIIKQTINLRVDEFKKQNMAKSVAFNFRKCVVAMKTFSYYLAHTLIPAKLGLYHKWGFHYDKGMERKETHFVVGVASTLGLLGIFLLTPHWEVKFVILWFVSFVSIFLNWITIQQFVTERYIFLPTFATCLLLSLLTKDYFWAYTLIFGLYICRTWLHLPTYDNELRYYQSNLWNFPDSEVAYGNLGATYSKLGQHGAALDAWGTATRINPDYDVPFYNIFSHYRANADLMIRNGDYVGGMNTYRMALPFLEKTLACGVCHFPGQWKEEHKDLLDKIKNTPRFFLSELNRLEILLNDLKIRRNNLSEAPNYEGIDISIRDAIGQRDRLKEYMLVNNMKVIPTADGLLASLTRPQGG